MSRDRNTLAQIIKNWAQDHDYNYVIADQNTVGDLSVDNTAAYFTWLIQSNNKDIDLLGLLNRLDVYVKNIRDHKHPDGMFCKRCQSFYQFAEPNQEDGTLLCYTCRSNPYI